MNRKKSYKSQYKFEKVTHKNLHKKHTQAQVHKNMHNHTHIHAHSHTHTKKRQDVAIDFKNSVPVVVSIRDIFEIWSSFDVDTIQS